MTEAELTLLNKEEYDKRVRVGANCLNPDCDGVIIDVSSKGLEHTAEGEIEKYEIKCSRGHVYVVGVKLHEHPLGSTLNNSLPQPQDIFQSLALSLVILLIFLILKYATPNILPFSSYVLFSSFFTYVLAGVIYYLTNRA